MKSFNRQIKDRPEGVTNIPIGDCFVCEGCDEVRVMEAVGEVHRFEVTQDGKLLGPCCAGVPGEAVTA